MIGGGLALALALFAARGEAIPDEAEQNPSVDLDPCLDVDEAAVRNLIELELRDVRARDASASISVAVRCLAGAQEIRVEPWASLGEDGIRTIELTTAEDADLAAQEARSRELALAIAELIRRLEITHPLASAPPPPPQPAPPPVVIEPAPAPRPDGSEGRWQLGVLSSFDSFAGGQWLAGGDLFASAPIGRWILADLRVGGRLVDRETLPSGRLTARAGTAAAAGGLNLWSRRRAVGAALMVRAQGYLVDYRAELPGDGGTRTALLGAFVVAAEPRLLFGVTRRVWLMAAAAAGLTVHGIAVRTQGTGTDSLSGLCLLGNLGVVLTF